MGGFNLSDWNNIISMAAGIIAIVAGTYAFFQWIRKSRRRNVKPPDPERIEGSGQAPRSVLPEETGPDQPAFQVPLPRNLQLRHADGWLEKVEAALDDPAREGTARRVALQGQAGVGKTAVALEYAFRKAGAYPGGVFWLAAEGGPGPALLEIAERMTADGLDCVIREGQSGRESLRCFLGFLNRRGRSLVVLDNVEDPAWTREFNPKNADVIATTRLTDLDLPLIALDLPPEDQALDILLGYAGKEAAGLSGPERDKAEHIRRKAGELPYALEILGILARSEGLVNLAGRLDRVADLSTGSRLSITHVLALAGKEFDHPRALEALPYLGYLDPDDLTGRVLALALETEEAEAALILGSLARFSVVKAKTEGGYTIHRLTQEAVRGQDPESGIGARVARAVTALVDRVTESSTYRQGYFLIPHLIHLAGLVDEKAGLEEFPEVGLVDSWATFLWQAGFYEYSEQLNRATLARVRREKGDEHPDCGDLLNDIGVTVREQGRLEEAEELFLQALALGEKTLGTGHNDYAVRLNNLATVYKFQEKYAKAEELYRRALEITASTTGKQSPEYAIRLNNLATVIENQGDLKEAESLYRQALEVDERTVGRRHPQYAVRLNNLAGTIRDQGRHQEAEELYRRALEVDAELLGQDHPDYAIDLVNLGHTVRKQGKKDEARELYRQAVEIFAERLGEDHPYTKTTRKHLEDVTEEMG